MILKSTAMDEDKLQYLIEEFRSHKKESNDKLEKILVQTTRTNGRVDNLMQFKETAEEGLLLIKKDIQGLKDTNTKKEGSDALWKNIKNAIWAIALIIITALITAKFKQ